MHLAAVAIVALSAAQAVPLPDFTLKAVTVEKPPENPAQLFSETALLSEEIIPKSYTQYVFHLTETNTRIPLGLEAEIPNREYESLRGMDPKSFSCLWARPGQILSLSWTTHNIASGHWTIQGLVAVARVDEGWIEVLRTFGGGQYSGGGTAKSFGNISLVDSPDSGGLVFRSSSYEFSASSSWVPLSRIIKLNDTEVLHACSILRVTEWPCTIEEGKLRFGEGIEYLDLGKDVFPAREVAQLEAGLPEVQTDEQESKLGEKLTELGELNPGLVGAEEWTGSIRTRTMPPYAPNPTHRWRMR